MVKGVSDQFLRILNNERRVAVRSVAAGIVAAALALFMANLADEPLFGTESFAYAVALFVGVATGVAVGWRRSTRFEESLRAGWNAWMRFSLSCARVDEVYRKASNRPAPSAVAAGVLAGALVVANALLFALLWVEAPAARALGVPVALADGLAAGAWIGSSAWSLGWTRSFRKALAELVRDGSIGIWGER